MGKVPKQSRVIYPEKNVPDADSLRQPPAARTKVTIAEVARAAGVSPMTVSRVINDPESVAEARRAAVLRAIETLRYSPNTAAKALAGRKQVHLVLFYDNPSAAYLSTFLLGSIEAAQRQHAQLTVIQCPAGSEKKAIRELLSIGAEGVLLPPPLCDSAKLHAAIRTAGLVSVSVAGGARFRDTPSVRIDDFAAAAAMTRHILSLGHRRIGFIAGNPDQMASAERTRGYRSALAEAGIPVDEVLIAQGLFTYRSGLTACESLLDLADPPTAVFASNDDMAAAAVAVAHRRHLDVPSDFTVCGFDDTDMARSIWPELTTIHQPISEMASAATSLLIEQIRGQQRGRMPEAKTHEWEFRLIRRGSDGPPNGPSECSIAAGVIMPKHDHHKAAEHHDEAAKSHRAAAEAHEKGDEAQASQHSQIANDHSDKAQEASNEAHKKTKGPKTL